MDTKTTTDTMRESARKMRYYADEMDQIAKRMDETKDFSYVGEALSVFSNLMSNCRLDLFATRPLREMQRRINKLEDME